MRWLVFTVSRIPFQPTSLNVHLTQTIITHVL